MPLLLFLACLLAVAYWKAIAAFAVVYGAHKTLCWYRDRGERKKAAQRLAERRLIDNADREHCQFLRGSLDGVYGDFPVPDVTRGIGVRLCG
jgi:hypothetical protein